MYNYSLLKSQSGTNDKCIPHHLADRWCLRFHLKCYAQMPERDLSSSTTKICFLYKRKKVNIKRTIELQKQCWRPTNVLTVSGWEFAADLVPFVSSFSNASLTKPGTSTSGIFLSSSLTGSLSFCLIMVLRASNETASFVLVLVVGWAGGMGLGVLLSLTGWAEQILRAIMSCGLSSSDAWLNRLFRGASLSLIDKPSILLLNSSLRISGFIRREYTMSNLGSSRKKPLYAWRYSRCRYRQSESSPRPSSSQ